VIRAEINQARRIVRIEREDSNWDVDDNFQRRLLSSALDAEQDGEVRVEEALIGELTAINVAVYVSLQLRRIAESIKVHH
jgi:hypothetical protein